MTAATLTGTTTAGAARRPWIGWAFADTRTVAWRNLRGAMRQPQIIVFSTIQPVIFVLNFRYVFGNAIAASLPPGVPYVDYLMPGIFVQTVTFGATATAVAMATDLGNGIIERFRSLPMSRAAVLAGRTVSDLVRNSFVLVLMLAVGFLVGFRVHTSVGGLIAAYLLLLLFMFSLSWLFATVGMVIRNPEAAQAATFPILAVLVFASSAFVPTYTMPEPLQTYAEHQPVSAMADAVRALVLGGPTADKVIAAIAWCVGIIAVFAPLAISKYRKST